MDVTQFSKIPLTYEQQADLLIVRGLIADRNALIACLQAVNYYRLSGYLFSFRDGGDSFLPGTSLEKIWRRYAFDRQLRISILDAIERVEISTRAALAYEHAHAYGPFGYTNIANMPNLRKDQYDKLVNSIGEGTKASKETFILHFKTKYGGTPSHYPPLWMAAELMTMGTTLTFFRGVDIAIKKSVASRFNQPDEVFDSWLGALHSVRNICAHHARLWNRELGITPKIPKARKHPEWHVPVHIDNRRVFAILTVLRYLLAIIAPQSDWPRRLEGLLDSYPDIPLDEMGFPADWNDCPIWKSHV